MSDLNVSKTDVNLSTLFNKAFERHQQNEWVAADSLYREILKVQPLYFEALHMLGVLHMQCGKADEGVALIAAAIEQNSNSAEAHNNLGNGYLLLMSHGEAIKNYVRAIEINPHYREAYTNLCSALLQVGRLDEAIIYCQRALDIWPDHVAIQCVLGGIYFKLNRYEEALDCYQKALVINPQDAQCLSGCGDALSKIGRLEDAVLSYEKGLLIFPNNVEILNGLGLVFVALQRFDEAIKCFERVLVIVPHHARPYNNIGCALSKKESYEKAAEYFEKAIAIDPNDALAYQNYGSALFPQRRYKETIVACEKSLALDPNGIGSYVNLGRALETFNQMKRAVDCYEKALALQPDQEDANFNISLAKLALGDYKVGFEQYEWRWRNESTKLKLPPSSQPMLQTLREASGSVVLIWSEQGLGDALQFVRYVPMLAKAGATVFLLVKPALAEFFMDMPGVEAVFVPDQPLPQRDYHCPMMSLPRVFGTTIKTIPAEIPYLYADTSKVLAWQARLGKKNGVRIGLAWSGSAEHRHDFKRSIPLAAFERLCKLPGCQLVSLQQEVRITDQASLAEFGVRHFGNELTDFTDTAALVSCMDMVVSVDTSIAHLAGGLGMPLKVLLPFVAEWRWLMDRSDSPWYPTAVLYRQPENGDWGSVIQQLTLDIQNLPKRNCLNSFLSRLWLA